MQPLPTIPGYELLTRLGGGVLTSVYAARDRSDDTACAVKVIREDWEDQPTAIKLLQREARACLAVRHAHLVRLLKAHVTRPPYFLVMEQLPWVVVAEVQVRPPLVGRASLNETLVAAELPAIAGLLTTMLKLACPPMVKVPPLGDFTTLSWAAGGVQVSDP